MWDLVGFKMPKVASLLPLVISIACERAVISYRTKTVDR